jgi:hypothetical protein
MRWRILQWGRVRGLLHTHLPNLQSRMGSGPLLSKVFYPVETRGSFANEKVSSMKTKARFSLILQGGFLFIMIAGSAFASDVIAVMKSPTVVYRLKASNGAFLGQINPPGCVQAVGCDGETIAVLSNSGTISRYKADTGAFLGQINPAGRCTDVQVSGGVIIARSANTASRYSTRTGAFLGQSQF